MVKNVKDINLFKTNNLEIGLILPYKDTYSVKVICKTAQNFEHVVYKKDFIDVKMYNADFISFYSHLNGTTLWESSKNEIQKLTSDKIDDTLKWSDMSSVWDLPQKPNDPIEIFDVSYDHLDLIEFKQSLSNLDTVEESLLKPMIWSNTRALTWVETEHLWWDNIGTSMTTWTLFSILDLDSSNEIIMNGNDSLGLNYLDSFNSMSESAKLEATLLTVKQLNESFNSFSDFIYYYSPYFTLDDLNNSILKHDIKAVSKKFSSNKMHTVSCLNTDKSVVAKEAIDFGFIGDTPAYFDIYKKSDDSSTVVLTINKITENSNYIEPSFVQNDYFEDSGEELLQTSSITLSGTIQDYLTQLNSSTDELISSFTYSLHQVISDFGDTPITFKISAISKYTDSLINFYIGLNEYTNVIVTPFARPIVKNPSYQNISIVKYAKELPLYSRLFFTTDNCCISGITSTKWSFKNTSAINFKDIYLNSYIVSYLFSVKGSYDISLDVTDKNGITNIVTKTELIKLT